VDRIRAHLPEGLLDDHRVVVVAILLVVGGTDETSADENVVAAAKILGCSFADCIPGGDAVPFRALLPCASRVFPRLLGSDGKHEVGDWVAILAVVALAALGVFADEADELD